MLGEECIVSIDIYCGYELECCLLQGKVWEPVSNSICVYLTMVDTIAFTYRGAAIVVSVVGMKIFRSSFSDISRQHVILLLSYLFFNYDYAHLSEGLPLNYFIAGILFSKVSLNMLCNQLYE